MVWVYRGLGWVHGRRERGEGSERKGRRKQATLRIGSLTQRVGFASFICLHLMFACMYALRDASSPYLFLFDSLVVLAHP